MGTPWKKDSIVEPIPATLRTAMHGWVGYLDEMMIDRITHRDVDGEALVELAVAALIATLRAAVTIDQSISLPDEVIEAWQHLSGQWPSNH